MVDNIDQQSPAEVQPQVHVSSSRLRAVVAGVGAAMVVLFGGVVAFTVLQGADSNPSVTDATAPPVDTVAHSEFRKAVGLRSDLAFVDSLYAASAPPEVVASEEVWPTRVTPDESAVLSEMRADPSMAAELGVAYATTIGGGDYAGRLLDNGLLIFRFADAVTTHRAELAKVFMSLEQFTVEEALFTIDELEGFARLVHDTPTPPEFQLTGTGTQGRSNVVTIFVYPADEDARIFYSELLPPDSFEIVGSQQSNP